MHAPHLASRNPVAEPLLVAAIALSRSLSAPSVVELHRADRALCRGHVVPHQQERQRRTTADTLSPNQFEWLWEGWCGRSAQLISAGFSRTLSRPEKHPASSVATRARGEESGKVERRRFQQGRRITKRLFQRNWLCLNAKAAVKGGPEVRLGRDCTR